MKKEIEEASSKFSFAAIIIGDFVQGALFLLLNGPIVLAVAITGRAPMSLVEGYMIAAGEAKALLSQSQGALPVALLLVVCLVLSQIISPFATLLGFALDGALRVWSQPGYSARHWSPESYALYLGRLMREPTAKAHWEWELFLFYQRRGAVASFLVWLALLAWIRWYHWGPQFNTAYFLEACFAIVLFISRVIVALEGSRIMNRTYDLYANLPELPHRQHAP
jgi:hypothetical protein